MSEVFALTPVERHSAQWARFSEHLKQKLYDVRAANDGDKDPVQTAKLRGQIGLLKALIALGDEPVKPAA